MLFGYLVVLCFGGVLSTTVWDSNFYMDSVINKQLINVLRQRNLSPAALPNFQNSFFHKLSGMTVNVYGDYSRGQLSGLQYVQRARDCSAPFWSYGNSTINCTLTLRNLGISYVAKLGYGAVSVNNVYATANVSATNLVIQTTTSPSRNMPLLSKFQIQSMGQVKPKFTNLGPMNTFQKSLETHFASSCAAHTMSFLNYQFRIALQDSVRALTMPMPR